MGEVLLLQEFHCCNMGLGLTLSCDKNNNEGLPISVNYFSFRGAKNILTISSFNNLGQVSKGLIQSSI